MEFDADRSSPRGGYTKPKRVRFRFQSSSSSSPPATPKQKRNQHRPAQSTQRKQSQSSSSTDPPHKHYMTLKQASHQSNDCKMYVLQARIRRDGNLELKETKKTPNQIAQYLRAGASGKLQTSTQCIRSFLSRNKKKIATESSYATLYKNTGILGGKRVRIAKTPGGIFPTYVVRRACSKQKPQAAQSKTIQPRQLTNESYQKANRASNRSRSRSNSDSNSSNDSRSSRRDSKSKRGRKGRRRAKPNSSSGYKQNLSTFVESLIGNKTPDIQEQNQEQAPPIFSFLGAPDENTLTADGTHYTLNADTITDARTKSILCDAVQFAHDRVPSTMAVSDALQDNDDLARSFLRIPYSKNQLETDDEKRDAYMGFARQLHASKQPRLVGPDQMNRDLASAVLRLAKIAYTTVSGNSDAPDEPYLEPDDCTYAEFDNSVYKDSRSAAVLKRLLTHIQKRRDDHRKINFQQIMRMKPEEASKLLRYGLNANEDQSNLKTAYRRLLQRIHPDKLQSNGQVVQFCANYMVKMLNAAIEIVEKTSN